MHRGQWGGGRGRVTPSICPAMKMKFVFMSCRLIALLPPLLSSLRSCCAQGKRKQKEGDLLAVAELKTLRDGPEPWLQDAWASSDPEAKAPRGLSRLYLQLWFHLQVQHGKNVPLQVVLLCWSGLYWREGSALRLGASWEHTHGRAGGESDPAFALSMSG